MMMRKILKMMIMIPHACICLILRINSWVLETLWRRKMNACVITTIPSHANLYQPTLLSFIFPPAFI